MNRSSINKTILITGTIMALIAVLLGAFGAHGLKKIVGPESVASFSTGVRYQMYHAIVCLILGNMTVLSEKKGHGLKKREIIRTYCDNSIDFFE